MSRWTPAVGSVSILGHTDTLMAKPNMKAALWRRLARHRAGCDQERRARDETAKDEVVARQGTWLKHPNSDARNCGAKGYSVRYVTRAARLGAG